MSRGLILFMLVLSIIFLLLLKTSYEEGFYSGYINDPNLPPMAYDLNRPAGGPEMFQGPMTMYGPTMNNPGDTISNMYQHPLMYPYQYYPKNPWYPKAGMPCSEGECGATGQCDNGICKINKTSNTVFDTPIQ